MSDVYQKSKNIPIPCRVGLVSALRNLAIGESFAVPEKKKSSIHPAARRAGVQVTLRTLGDGTVRIWRIDDEAEVKPESIFGEPPVAPALTSAAQAPVVKPAAAPEPKTVVSKTRAQGGHYVETQYGPRIFVPDENIFG